jgi:hypothetical protein
VRDGGTVSGMGESGEGNTGGCKGNLAVLRLITQASKGGSKENI